MNDFVFIEENKYKFNKEKILIDIHQDSFFTFPLNNNNNEVVGLFSI
jgi:hypothetical protein